MRVLVAHNMYRSGIPSGENAVVRQEIELLRNAGVEVTTLIRSSDELEDAGALAKVRAAGSAIHSRAGAASMRATIDSARPDVVHVHNVYPLLSPSIVRIAAAAGIPVVQTVHNYRHVCANATFFRAGEPCHQCRGRRFPFPALGHGCYRDSRLQTIPMAISLAANRSAWQGVTRFLALSPPIETFLRGLGVGADRIVIRPNFVADPGEYTGSGSGFLFAGRLSQEKGVGVLLDAWCRLPEGASGTLRIAGSGPLADQVRRVVDRRADVEFLGQLDRSDLYRTMRASGAVVLPSEWDEVCPMIALEAFANARPVLGTRVGGIPYLIGEGSGGAGWVVDPTPAALAAGIRQAHRDAASASHAARQRFVERFSPDAGLASLLGVYEEAVDVGSRDG